MTITAIAAPEPGDDDALMADDAAYQRGFDDGQGSEDKRLLKAYNAQSTRLSYLLSFVDQYGPHPLEIGDSVYDAVDDIEDDDVTSARNLALVAAYKAIRRIANES